MAHFSTPTVNPGPGDRPCIRRPKPEEHTTALAVLLTGRPTPSHPAVDHFIHFAHHQGFSLEGLWAAYTDQTPDCAALIIPGVGRTAVMFVSPSPDVRQIRVMTELIQNVLQRQDPDRLRLIQVLLEPAQKREQQALEQAGFSSLASLVYMRRSSLARHNLMDADPAATGLTDTIACDGRVLKAMSWRDDDYDAFALAIETSYLNTLDCPDLVGVRDLDDIIAGHKAVGQFEPDLWTVYYQDDQPAAVLLLNPLIDRMELELVYLGLAPAFRGKGLARRLMQRALATARARDKTGIHLAVDERNQPAMKLYQGLGFRATGRKLAMIYVLKTSNG